MSERARGFESHPLRFRGKLEEASLLYFLRSFRWQECLRIGRQEGNTNLEFKDRRNEIVMEHEYQKLANFRDMGGMRGAHGKAVKKNRLLRSGEYRGSADEK